jgi:hypothetical protein
MSETRVVSIGIAIALGLLSVLLAVGLGSAIMYYTGVVAGRDNTIQTLTAEKTQLGSWLEGNMSLLQAALIERGSIETKLDDPRSGLPGIQSNFTSVLDALEALNASRTRPALDLSIIAEDDPVRNTGIMALGILPAGQSPSPYYQPGTDLVAHYKVTIAYNGIPVQPNFLVLQVLKRTVYNPSSKQFPDETLASKLTDASSDFVMMVRSGSPGVAELDVYYVGPLNSEHVAEYTLVITSMLRIGTDVVYGTSLQSLCMLGWSMDPYYPPASTVLPDGTTHRFWVNPLGTFISCDEAVLWQRIKLGLRVPQG